MCENTVFSDVPVLTVVFYLLHPAMFHNWLASCCVFISANVLCVVWPYRRCYSSTFISYCRIASVRARKKNTINVVEISVGALHYCKRYEIKASLTQLKQNVSYTTIAYVVDWDGKPFLCFHFAVGFSLRKLSQQVFNLNWNLFNFQFIPRVTQI